MSKEDRHLEYTAENFTLLRGADQLRARPGMFIGDTGEGGLYRLVMEIHAICVDCATPPLAFGVELLPDGGLRAECPSLALEPTALESWAMESRGIGPGDIELCIVNAFSRSLVIDVHSEGTHWRQAFAQGRTLSSLESLGPSSGIGTSFTFFPDPAIFTQGTAVPMHRLAGRFRESAALAPGSRYTLRAPGEAEQVFHSPAGLVDLLAHHTQALTPVSAPITGTIETEEGRARIAFAWYEGATEAIHGYCNTGRVLRGEHLRGVRYSLTRHVPTLGSRLPGLRDRQAGQRVTFADIVRTGFVAVISIDLPSPRYQGSTKDHLNNVEGYRLALALVRQCLEGFARDRPGEARAVEEFLVAAHIDPKSGTATM